MEARKETQQPLIEQLKEYAETRIKLAKYKAIDGAAGIAASIIADVVVVISLLLAFIFASFTLAFYLSQLLASYWAGFGCVTLLYILIAVLTKTNKGALEKPIIDVFVQKFFKP